MTPPARAPRPPNEEFDSITGTQRECFAHGARNGGLVRRRQRPHGHLAPPQRVRRQCAARRLDRATAVAAQPAARLRVARCATRYVWRMIQAIRHKGLRRFFASGSLAGIQPAHANRLRMQLTALDTSQTIKDMDIPGFRLHALKGRARAMVDCGERQLACHLRGSRWTCLHHRLRG